MNNWGLRGDALDVARECERRWPGSVISGKRSIEEQAAVMAANESIHRGWIEATYVDSSAKRACTLWRREHPRASRRALQSGLLSTLNGLLPSELGLLTLHLTGDAFDADPARAPEIAPWLHAEALRLGGRFIENEGGLRRLHWQAKRRSL